jgi:hypothetical protein
MRNVINLYFLISLTGIGGCSLELPVKVEPGNTVDLIAASSSQATYEFTTKYKAVELPYMREAADKECIRYGRHAGLPQIAEYTFDRSRATYRCE